MQAWFERNRTYILIMWFGTLTFIAFFATTRFGEGSVAIIIGAAFTLWGSKRITERIKGVNHVKPTHE